MLGVLKDATADQIQRLASPRSCSGRGGREDRFSSRAVRMLTSVDSWGWTTDPLKWPRSSTPAQQTSGQGRFLKPAFLLFTRRRPEARPRCRIARSGGVSLPFRPGLSRTRDTGLVAAGLDYGLSQRALIAVSARSGDVAELLTRRLAALAHSGLKALDEPTVRAVVRQAVRDVRTAKPIPTMDT
ncbi:hypothetical protein ACFQ2K_05410 [Streptomyces sanglieri]|uniref:Uncharacterized protein n=1 Tax=Streptomyces sanglieri TaxID=193460 RepID=A0ABW2WLC7_9ACTN